MRTPKVLLIENRRREEDSFATALQRRYQVQIAHSGKEGLDMAKTLHPDIVVLDAASLRTSGSRICARLRAGLGELPIIHIRAQHTSAEPSVANVVLTPPFTPRKLINRIERFVSAVREGSVLVLGPFSLNLEQQTLTMPWAEKKLTPKLVALMEMFIRRPNETLERRYLMQEIWKTDYMGDTRTLDVHIRWLRKIIEPTPRQPRYVLTVRGEGYYFTIPPDGETPELPTDGAEEL